MTTKPDQTMVYLCLPKADFENACQYLDRAIEKIKQASSLEEARDDILSTLKFIAFLLGGRS